MGRPALLFVGRVRLPAPSRENATPAAEHILNRPLPGRQNNAKTHGFSTKISEDVEKPIGGCIFLRKNVVK